MWRLIAGVSAVVMLFYYDAYSDQSFAYKGEWKMNGGV